MISKMKKLRARQKALEAEVVMEKLAEEFVAAKVAGVDRKVRPSMRQARQDYRDNLRLSAAEGAQPANIGVSAEVENV